MWLDGLIPRLLLQHACSYHQDQFCRQLMVAFLLTSFVYHMHTSPCRHILFTPQSYHVASTESFSFTSYSTERFEVTATLSYDQCSCSNRRRSCNNNGNVLSSVGGTTRFGMYDCHVIAPHSCSKFAVPSVDTV